MENYLAKDPIINVVYTIDEPAAADDTDDGYRLHDQRKNALSTYLVKHDV